jgi:hypothetical protein
MRLAAISIVILLSSNFAFAAVDKVPTFDVDPSCRAAVVSGLGNGRTLHACLNDERDAHAQLTKQWTEFPSADRNQCGSLATMGGPKSYVELLTCLEMARDVRRLRDSNGETGGTTGLGTTAPAGLGRH